MSDSLVTLCVNAVKDIPIEIEYYFFSPTQTTHIHKTRLL